MKKLCSIRCQFLSYSARFREIESTFSRFRNIPVTSTWAPIYCCASPTSALTGSGEERGTISGVVRASESGKWCREQQRERCPDSGRAGGVVNIGGLRGTGIWSSNWRNWNVSESRKNWLNSSESDRIWQKLTTVWTKFFQFFRRIIFRTQFLFFRFCQIFLNFLELWNLNCRMFSNSN